MARRIRRDARSLTPRFGKNCILWPGEINRHGYGLIKLSAVRARTLGIDQDVPRRTYLAHRIFYRAAHGPIPDDLVLDHTCHNADIACTGKGKDCPHRRCINVSHLEAVPNGVNAARGRSVQLHERQRNAATCKRGHPWTPENTQMRANGTRRCKECIHLLGGYHQRRSKTHCPDGHPWRPETTYWHGNHKTCRLCRSEREWRAIHPDAKPYKPRPRRRKPDLSTSPLG